MNQANTSTVHTVCARKTGENILSCSKHSSRTDQHLGLMLSDLGNTLVLYLTPVDDGMGRGKTNKTTFQQSTSLF